jgi:hypothetical protein
MRSIVIGTGFAACCLMGIALAAGGRAIDATLVFPLEEVSGFGVSGGHTCLCSDQAEPKVIYPPFSSTRPLYGVLRVDMEPGNQRSGTPYHFALDESAGTGAGYDRLYLDLDRDNSLSTESPLTPLADPPAGALLTSSGPLQQVCFRYITFSSGTAATAVHSLETMPQLIVPDQGPATLMFVATKARQGQIEIASRRYGVTLVNRYPLSTRWDRPGINIKFEPRNSLAHMPVWFGADWLMALHEINGTLWGLSATPEGDRLLVEPYRGDFGMLSIGSARRFAWRKGLEGSLLAKDKIVLVGKDSPGEPREPVASWRVPVGEYAPESFHVHYGPLYVSLSSNYHVEDVPRGKEVLARPLQIRKDQTCVLDFSKKAEVLFTRPARSARVKPGDELAVYAVLVDPKLDIMIRDLRRKPSLAVSPYMMALIGAVALIPLTLGLLSGEVRRRYPLLPPICVAGLVVLAAGMGALHVANAKLHPQRSDLSAYEVLNPRVTICRANGKVVASGVMPFG